MARIVKRTPTGRWGKTRAEGFEVVGGMIDHRTGLHKSAIINVGDHVLTLEAHEVGELWNWFHRKETQT